MGSYPVLCTRADYPTRIRGTIRFHCSSPSADRMEYHHKPLTFRRFRRNHVISTVFAKRSTVHQCDDIAIADIAAPELFRQHAGPIGVLHFPFQQSYRRTPCRGFLRQRSNVSSIVNGHSSQPRNIGVCSYVTPLAGTFSESTKRTIPLAADCAPCRRHNRVAPSR